MDDQATPLQPSAPGRVRGSKPLLEEVSTLNKARSCKIFPRLFLSLPAMALNIPHPDANRLAEEVAALAGENKTDAVILALRERLQRLRQQRLPTFSAQNALVSQLD